MDGISRLRGEEFDSFRSRNGLSQSSVFAVLEDREATLWAGTKEGLNQFVDGSSIPYGSNEGLPSNRVGPLLEDRDGTIWVGMLGSGLARFDGHRFTTLSDREGLASPVVRALVEGSDGSLWVGTMAGVNRLRGGRVTETYGRSSGLPSGEILCLSMDGAGAIWAGTADGLARFNGSGFVVAGGTRGQSIRAISSDREGRVVYATEFGVFRWEAGRPKEIRDAGSSLRGILGLYRDSEGILWMGGSTDGVFLYDSASRGAKLPVFTPQDGMFDSEIYGFLQDNQDRLWMTCSRGIFWVARAEMKRFARGEIQRVSSVPYTPQDRQRVLKANPGIQPGAISVRNGLLWLSTIRGIRVLDPNRRKGRAAEVATVIDRPVVNGVPEDPGDISELPAGQKNIRFNYSGLSYIQPMRTTFRYLLEGFDKNWTDAGMRREAFYTNLPPGKYRFRVLGCSSETNCVEAPSPVVFSLRPMLHQRVWFAPSLLLLGILGVWVSYRIHLRRLRLKYDLIVAERSRIARELHDTLIQGFSGVTMAMQALAARLIREENRAALQEIIDDAATCLRETRRSVAGLRGSGAPIEGSTFTAAMEEAVRQITETTDIRVKQNLNAPARLLTAEEEYNLLRIAAEAVANAVKHAAASTIEVSLKNTRAGVLLTIADDGCGFKESGEIRGHYGLIGMQERAAQIGAAFECDTAPGRGTRVTVTLCSDRAAELEPVA